MKERRDRIKFIKKGENDWLSHWVLWENEDFRIITLKNPNRPADHGGHIVVEQKVKECPVRVPYEDYRFFAKISVIAAVVQKAVELTRIAPHCNVQFNGNWAWRSPNGGLRELKEGKENRAVHAHIYPRTLHDPYWANPAYLATFQEHVIDQEYRDRAFTMKQMIRLRDFLMREIPVALEAIKRDF